MGPETKRRRLGLNGPSMGNGTSVRSGTGPRTRGMTGDNEMTPQSTSVLNGPSVEKSSSSSSGTGGSVIKKNNETGTQRERDHESSSSGPSSSDSSDTSDSEDSSDMDADECEKQREGCRETLTDLEKQFMYMREVWYRERIENADLTLAGIQSGTAREYLNPLERLQRNMAVRIKYAQSLRDFQLQSLQHKIEGEAIAARQNLESERALLIGDIRGSLEERIHRLEEDRNNDFTSDLWLETVLKRKNKKTTDIFGEKKKKPITVSGPFIVYMLQDVDILEDWTVMKKAVSAPKRGLLVL